ncbi:coatomer subunit gamma [Malassezia vespertilionis]|uniref:Coatomer subunit gamma n=1 Tax=Malassezia vespertilionis TaxID=2020962 RepID=A0A2N1J9X6_9BASI|nr:coatomer subunit gamma [Malassezia vespertilionis]PKI83359.1 Sec21p [Malassezia vespertilionis]WFD07349.1 coatomer subunit gamma [Malassezia vespertilionis]
MSFKKDEESGVTAIRQDKTVVIQEARAFHDSNISPRKCRVLITKILYLLYMGEKLSRQEATSLFFGATKLFQNKDAAMRQIVYLVIKELSPYADDVIMVTASIMKDMQPNTEVIYRPNAIRALTRIVDPSMVQGLERYLKSAIVDRNPSVACAAIVSSYHLYICAREVVRRWGNEVTEAIHMRPAASSAASSFGLNLPGPLLSLRFGGDNAPSDVDQTTLPSMSYIVQYHALGLLYLSRQNDRMAVTKLVQQLGGSKGSSQSIALRNPFALCMLVRYAAKIAEEDANMRPLMVELLEGWLRHKSDMVNYEAARALCAMNISTEQQARAITVLQMFLSSPRSTLKFAAVRTLAELAQTRPASVQACNVDMENLITDANRGVATYAIATLLKTGNESSVDRLIKQISGFMSEISDEFKVIVVDAIRSLSFKFPSKQSAMLSFLSGVLRDEGGYEFKRAVVEAIFSMAKFVKGSKEVALGHLCEFIEDCEFTRLNVRILHLLGLEGPKMPEPHKYIRFIYNRVILENAIVRAAAVSSLSKFGSQNAQLTERIRVLLQRCLEDVDDEVRDRAVLSLRLLDPTILHATLVEDASVPDLAVLEQNLALYTQSDTTQPFDYASVPRISPADAARQAAEAGKRDSFAVTGMASNALAETDAIPPTPSEHPALDLYASYATQLAGITEFASYGTLLASAPILAPAPLTESETEYVVTAVKHVFSEHIVLQYNITNTLPEIVLEDVVVVLGGTMEAGLEEEFILPITSLSAASPSGAVYVSLKRDALLPFPLATLKNTLQFVSKEVDPTSGEPEEEGYQDEYQTEELDLSTADYMRPTEVDFQAVWDEYAPAASASETFALTALESLDASCSTLVELLGMQALGGTETPSNPSVHTMMLAGRLARVTGLETVVARVRMMYEPSDGVTMQLSVRAPSEESCLFVLSAIA